MIHIFKKEVLGGRYPHSIVDADITIPLKELNNFRYKHQTPVRDKMKSGLIKEGVDKDLAEREANRICVYLHHKHSEKFVHFKMNTKEFSVLCDIPVKEIEKERYTTDRNKITCIHCRNKLKIK